MSDIWWAWREWLSANPEWIFGLIFGLAALEALAIIGSFIPAVPMMVALTLLAGSAGLNVWDVLLVAVLGAMLGDGLSYAIGHHYKHRIDGWWPFRRYPHWLSAAEGYVEKHGGKSIIIGRFVGPIRAFVPMAAGIFQMPYLRFLWFNFISALIWAPPNILPGFIAGAAVTHPFMPGKYQLFLVGGIMVTVALFVWLKPGLTALTRRWRLDHAPANRGLFYCADGRTENQASALVLGALGLIGFCVTALALPWLRPWDLWIAQELAALRQPAIDYVFLVFSLLGDRPALLTMGAVIMSWLALRREWRTLRFALLAMLVCLAVPSFLKWCFAVPRPMLVASPPDSWAFPSGHAFSAMVVWGFLYVLVARPMPDGPRLWPLGISLTLIAFTAMSRPFLGVHWASDIAAGLSLGLTFLALLRWAWYRSEGLRYAGPWEAPLVVVLAVLVAVTVWLLPGWPQATLLYQAI